MRAVLLYHLKNHYALIFAIREWDEEVQDAPPPASLAAPPDQQTCVNAHDTVAEIGTEAPVSGGGQPSRLVRRRQVLTARRAQRPSAWIDFEEVRSTLLGWTGYKLLMIGLGTSSGTA
jgi:hypothetical protein